MERGIGNNDNDTNNEGRGGAAGDDFPAGDSEGGGVAAGEGAGPFDFLYDRPSRGNGEHTMANFVAQSNNGQKQKGLMEDLLMRVALGPRYIHVMKTLREWENATLEE